MAVYISTTTDAFATTRANAKSDAKKTRGNIRRPLRGIQVKPNTYAVMRVMTAAGKPIELIDSGSVKHPDGIGRSENYANFIIQSYREARAEKQQIIETFGEDYVYFFGERPRFLEVSGTLINTADFDWKNEFWYNYEHHLRGTKLVEQNARLYFYFDDVVVEGYMLGASSMGDSNSPYMMPLQFQIFVTNYQILSSVGKVVFSMSDTGELGHGDYNPNAALEPILPETTPEALAGRTVVSTGGLNAFLAKTAEFANDASFTIQRTLETIRNTFYGRQLIVPEGLGSQGDSLAFAPPIKNAGQFLAAKYGQPIHTMTDEYVERDPASLDAATSVASAMELERVNALLYLRSPEALDANARAEFEKAGIDTGKPNAMMAILGRGAFAALQYVAPFGLAKIGGGKIGIADQASALVL